MLNESVSYIPLKDLPDGSDPVALQSWREEMMARYPGGKFIGPIKMRCELLPVERCREALARARFEERQKAERRALRPTWAQPDAQIGVE